jgi:hypothetical protein
VSDERPVHASHRTVGLPRPWEATNDGRWFHVGHGHEFAAHVEHVTCGACLSYIESDREAAAAHRKANP